MNFGTKWHFDLVRLVPPLVFAGLAIGYISQSGGFSDPTSAQAPLLYGELLLALSALIFALGLFAAFRGAGDPRARGADGAGFGPFARIYAMIAGFIALIFAVGFYGAIPVFLALFLSRVAKLPLWQSLAAASLSVFFVWLIFGKFLHMSVYAGYLMRYFAF